MIALKGGCLCNDMLLNILQAEAFESHIGGCQACEQELRCAQVMLDTVGDLPLLDGPDAYPSFVGRRC